MRRREFITLVGGAAAWPLVARAQQFGKMPRVGVLVTLSAPHPFTEALRSGMRDLGYIEGQNVTFEWRYADAQFSRAVELAAELVGVQVDVIAAYHTPAVRAAMNATRTIPDCPTWKRSLAASASTSCTRSSRGSPGRCYRR